ncbi:hypothetical protein BESB_002820 [Besnoitia besnoiti]|uniref:JmjC domain-containing protein n=1 Tax=Besnoitia besnoiti TaxID=94643 RepID=A0A2A9MN62_BESBE|nr:hypothetical protein BESB_002820 [Besnoitia besnoiti]PFH37941.1 hypothetical protein BESB_002820 [Besnoitia besnoiti]
METEKRDEMLQRERQLLRAAARQRPCAECILCRSNACIERWQIAPISAFSLAHAESKVFWDTAFFPVAARDRRPLFLGPFADEALGGALTALTVDSLLEKMAHEQKKRVSVHVAPSRCLNFVAKNFKYEFMDFSELVQSIRRELRSGRGTAARRDAPAGRGEASDASSIPESHAEAADSSSRRYFYFRSLGRRPAKDPSSLAALSPAVAAAFRLPPGLRLEDATGAPCPSSPTPSTSSASPESSSSSYSASASPSCDACSARREAAKEPARRRDGEVTHAGRIKQTIGEKGAGGCSSAPAEAPVEAHSTVLRVAQPGLELWTHYDIPDNFLVQISGYKRVFLFPPSAVDRLAIRCSSSPVEGLVSGSSEFEQTHPEAVGALREARYVDLSPGSILFLPTRWIHGVLAFPAWTDLCAGCRSYVEALGSRSVEPVGDARASHGADAQQRGCERDSGVLDATAEATARGLSTAQSLKEEDARETPDACVSVNVFFYDRTVPNAEAVYAKKDVYGNKDPEMYEEARAIIQEKVVPIFSALPDTSSAFYLRKLSLELQHIAKAMEENGNA